jgi:[ribosomal protein S18]-alanine N-acetyltransferase
MSAGYACRALTSSDVETLRGWHYPPPHDVHDPARDEERLARLLASDTWRAVADASGLAGFYGTGEEARAPGGPYRAPAVDFAIFLRPDLVGRGEGPQVLEPVLAEVAARHPGLPIRVTVAASNPRAARLARRLGFVDRGSFGGFRHGVAPHLVLVRDPR